MWEAYEMNLTTPERLMALETEFKYLRSDMTDVKAMVTQLHARSLEEKGSQKARGAIFWGGVGLMAFLSANLPQAYAFFFGPHSPG